MRRETLVCDKCGQVVPDLTSVEDDQGNVEELCGPHLLERVSDAKRAGLVAVRLEFAQPVSAPVRMRARR